MLDKNINPLHVKQISGHKKLESLESYNVASFAQQKFRSSASAIGNKTSTNETSSSKNTSNTPDKQERNSIAKVNGVPVGNEFSTCSSIFSGATLNNCAINIKINNPLQPPKKRRVLVIDDDDDE